MQIGDLVKINTKTLHFHEGKYGLVTSYWLAIKEDSLGDIRWYTVLIEDDEYCFKHTDLEVINGRED